MRPSDTRLLEIYLDDHWAGAAAGQSLAKRLHRQNRDTEWRDELAQLAQQIADDNRILASMRTDFGFEGGSTKRLVALLAERVSRLKPNGHLTVYSPLSRLIECEAMEAGVWAKKRLWIALQEGCDDRPELQHHDLRALVSRADAQLELLGAFHAYAASRAFGG